VNYYGARLFALQLQEVRAVRSSVSCLEWVLQRIDEFGVRLRNSPLNNIRCSMYCIFWDDSRTAILEGGLIVHSFLVKLFQFEEILFLLTLVSSVPESWPDEKELASELLQVILTRCPI
jgi:hypothetical protein